MHTPYIHCTRKLVSSSNSNRLFNNKILTSLLLGGRGGKGERETVMRHKQRWQAVTATYIVSSYPQLNRRNRSGNIQLFHRFNKKKKPILKIYQRSFPSCVGITSVCDTRQYRVFILFVNVLVPSDLISNLAKFLYYVVVTRLSTGYWHFLLYAICKNTKSDSIFGFLWGENFTQKQAKNTEL